MRVTIGSKERGETTFVSPGKGKKATHVVYETGRGYAISELPPGGRRLLLSEIPLVLEAEKSSDPSQIK
jgi:hypothetical protein